MIHPLRFMPYRGPGRVDAIMTLTIFRLRSLLVSLLALGAPILLAGVLDVFVAEPLRDARSLHIRLVPVYAGTAAELAARMEAEQYGWPPAAAVPRLGLTALPGDMASLDVTQRKAVFFRSVLPLAIAENARLARLRTTLEGVFAAGPLTPGTWRFRRASQIARAFRLEGDLNDTTLRAELLRRVDTIPVALLLAQAANESAWGGSRFALEGNALFGQWTWVPDAGITPRQRKKGARHQVRAYADLRGSVRAYLHNLNTGHAYEDLRALREAMRREGRAPDALALAGTLLRYSERREAYVAEVQALIRNNGLDQLPPLQLAALPGVTP